MKKWLIVFAIILLIAAIVLVFCKIQSRDSASVPDMAGQVVNAAPVETQTLISGLNVASGAPSGTETVVPELTGLTNILILGVDNYDADHMEDRGNSDGIMLLSINADNREMILTSFMRDTKVKVNEQRRDKLTNVYHENGLETFISVFEANFELPVDCYAVFNYYDAADIVDAVGGVEIELAEEEIYSLEPKIRNLCILKNADYEENKLTKDDVGRITLNGIQAASYARIRPAYGEYDAGRTERCRTIVTGIINKLYGLSMPEMLSFAGVFMDRTANDIPQELLLTLAAKAEELKSYRMVSDRIPLDGAYTSQNDGNGYYAVPDFEINNRHLQESIYHGKH